MVPIEYRILNPHWRTEMEHNHDHDEDCGCEDMQTVTITLEDDTELDCSVIGHFSVDNIDYIALLPENLDEVLIYRYTETDDFVDIENIESDEEFQRVSEVFQSILDEEEDEDEE